MRALSWAMLRKHAAAYVGCFAAMVLGSALMSGSIAMAAGTLSLDGVDVASAAPERRFQYSLTAELLGGMAGLTAFVAVVVSVVLIGSTMTFVVEGRRRELALLRLSGASRRQIVRIVVGEALALSVVAGVVGSLFATPIGSAYLAFFGDTYALPEGLTVHVHLEAMLLGILLTMIVALPAAFGPARRVGKVQPVEALSEGSSRLKPMTWVRWVVGLLALAGALAMFLIPADLDPSAFMWAALGQGMIALVALVQLAPVVVAPISRVVCGLLARVWPGAGTLAQGHSSWNAARTASLANPALLLVAVPGIFFLVFYGLGDSLTAASLRTMHADAVVEEAPEGDARLERADLGAVDGVAEAVPVAITGGDWWDVTDPDLPTEEQLLVTDLPALLTVADFAVLEGNIEDVEGNRIASSPDASHGLGTTFELKSPDDAQRTVEVVAVVEDLPVNRAYMVDADTFDLAGTDFLARSWFLDLDGGAAADVAPGVDAVAAAAGTTADTVSVEDWSRALTEDGNKQVFTSTMTMLGGACLLALLAVGVSIVTALRERQAEFALSRRAGAHNSTILGSTLLESVAVTAIAFVLAAGVLGVVWARLVQNARALDIGILPSVPWQIIGPFMAAGLAMALLGAVFGTRWALAAIRME